MRCLESMKREGERSESERESVRTKIEIEEKPWKHPQLNQKAKVVTLHRNRSEKLIPAA